jgi:hypothetical protein
MIALMRKELRELGLPAVALVFCAAIIAGMDLMYNLYYPQYKGQGIALLVWVVIAVALSFLGGASAIARENRARMVFLSEWPVSRGALWVVKAAVSFVLTMGVIAAGFVICLGAARLGHYEQVTDLHEALVGLAYVLPLCFGFGLLWSGLIGSVLGAGALGLLTLAGLGGGLTWLLAFYLPAQWGPYVGRPVDGLSPTLIWIAAALVLMVGAWAFVRYPVLEGKRRGLAAVGLLVGLTLAGMVVLVGHRVVVGRPTLEQQVAEAGLSQDGRMIYFGTAASKVKTERDAGLWVMPATGGKPRLVCRTNGQGLQQVANAAVFGCCNLGGEMASVWKYDFSRGQLRRLPGEMIETSPDGRYVVTMEQRGTMLRDEAGRVIRVSGEHYGAIILDNHAAYYRLQDGQLVALDLQTGQERELGRVSERANPVEVSPDGKWLALTYRDPRLGGTATVLLNVQTRVQRVFAGSAFGAGFVGDRYLWIRESSEDRSQRGVAIVDVEAEQVVRTLTGSAFQGVMLAPWHQEGVPYVVFAVVPKRQGPPPDPSGPPAPRRVYMAKPDGSGLRLLREERRQVLGMTAEGKIVMWDRGRTFVSWDPVSGEERVLVRLAEAR